jgi:hypothetical protein
LSGRVAFLGSSEGPLVFGEACVSLGFWPLTVEKSPLHK